MSPVEIATLFVVALSLQTGFVTGGAIALWKSLLIHHPYWTGYLVDGNGRYMNSFRTLSIQTDDFGIAHVEYTSRHISMEMEGQALPRHKKERSSKVGLYVGIPVVLAIIVISVGAMVMVWAFRKGYLRHVPFTYKSFRNADSSHPKGGNHMNMDKNQMPAHVAEQAAVHI